MIQEKKWAITTKKGKGELPLLCGNGERVNPIYASRDLGRSWPPLYPKLWHPGISTGSRLIIYVRIGLDGQHMG